MLPEKWTIPALRRAYREGACTPRDVAHELIVRARRFADKNIFITAPDETLLEPWLRRLEQTDPADHPLWGIPFAVKDNIDVAGCDTTAACPAYAYRPEKSAETVRRLIAAGAFPIGKTNLDQFATGLVGTRSSYGAAHNAWRDELISGGSSSGSAVAVALGLCAFSLGTDTAGSGRVPAALHGLYGWKPSRGALPSLGVVPACASLDCVAVFANTLEDCLTADAQMRGPATGDPWSRTLPRAGARRPGRVLLPANEPRFFGPFADAYRLAWNHARENISRLGLPAQTIGTALFDEAAAILYDGPYIAERWADLGAFVEGHPGEVLPPTETVLRSGARYTAAELFRAEHRLQALRAQAHALLEDAVMVLPTAGGTWTRAEVEADPIATNSQMGLYTNHCNLLDLCALSLPCGEAGEKLPFGITAFATAGGEDLIAGFAGVMGD